MQSREFVKMKTEIVEARTIGCTRRENFSTYSTISVISLDLYGVLTTPDCLSLP